MRRRLPLLRAAIAALTLLGAATVGASRYLRHMDQAEELYAAIAEGDAAHVAALLDQGADPNGLCPDTPHVRHDSALWALWERLLGRGSPGGMPLLLGAIRAHDWAVAETLVRHGADPNAGHSRGEPTPFLEVVGYGPASLVRVMLDHGADARSQDQSGLTPLEYVIGQGGTPAAEEQKVALLLEHGADANSGGLALAKAARQGSGSLVRLLLRYGADPTQRLVLGHKAGTPASVAATPALAALLRQAESEWRRTHPGARPRPVAILYP